MATQYKNPKSSENTPKNAKRRHCIKKLLKGY